MIILWLGPRGIADPIPMTYEVLDLLHAINPSMDPYCIGIQEIKARSSLAL